LCDQEALRVSNTLENWVYLPRYGWVAKNDWETFTCEPGALLWLTDALWFWAVPDEPVEME
jgi:hypothetical protein